MRRSKSAVALLSATLWLPNLLSAQTASPSISDLQIEGEAGDAAAQYKLGRAYAEGNSVAQDEHAAIEWYRKAAAQGNAEAQNSLGLMYFSGRGVEENWNEAVRWYHQAARQGNSLAMFNLGAAYYDGDREGNGTDNVAAYAWFKLADDSGNPSAKDAITRSEKELGGASQNQGLMHIAEMYFTGEELRRNISEAERWMQIVAERGDGAAQAKLAQMFLQQERPDYDKVSYWCKLAAQTRNSDGQYCLADLYRYGLGTSKSPGKALKLYQEAAAHGHAASMDAAAEMLMTGEAGKRNQQQAFVYLIQLAVMGNRNAAEKAVTIRRQMSQKEWKKTESKLKGSGYDTKKVEIALDNVQGQAQP